MGVEDIFLSLFITMMIEKLGSENLIRLARSARISSKLSHLSEILSEIQPLIADAALKQRTDEAVNDWLRELQHSAYDVDDLIDDLASKANNATTEDHKVLKKIIPTSCTPHNIIMYGGRKMSSRLDKITHRLQALSEAKNELHLNPVISRTPYATQRVDATSLVDDSESIVGREVDKYALMSRLLENEVVTYGQNFSVVSIVGMGGLGKTTLARLLCDDNKVKDQFELQAWVRVSDDFNVFDISKAIYQSLGGLEKTFVNLNLLQMALTEQLSNKRFLLVLDDVWNEDMEAWELLKRPFLVGAPGSKILVTTRKTQVASIMGSLGDYHLSRLSFNDGVSIIAQWVLNKPNFDSRRKLRPIAEAIVDKCNGLPLALKALGRLLRTKTDDEEWMELLSSEVWSLSDESGVLPALRLSYEDLPPHLKQMFAYCCLFPKDYVFHRDELVLLWMAEGFLYQANDIKFMEGFGRQCFKELELRSFFQQLRKDKNEYTMHDLVHHLATVVGGELFFALDDERGDDSLEKVCHLSFIRERFEVYSKFKALRKARRLRTLLAVSASLDDQQKFFLSNKVLTEIIPQLQFLRVLNLSNYSISEIPPSIGSLKHIRYLNFSRTDVTCLPEQVGDLYNLQSLLLCGCEKLHSLPNSLVKLSNLRHLDISDTPRLNNIPSGIGELKNLQTLSKVIIEGADGFKITELKGLLDLQGRLSIEGLHNVKIATQAKDANLQKKKGLHDVEMKWNDDFDDSVKRNTEYGVLEGLIPYHELRNLKILFYGGEKFPSWVGDPSFVCLTELTLRGCRSCSRLPTLGHLMSLRKLFIEGMNGVENVGSELLGPPNSFNGIDFPSLKVLEFKDMQAWKTWSMCSGDNSGTTTWFPTLREISIVNCPEVDVVSVGFIQSLQILRLQRCPKAVLESMVGVSSSIGKLMMENIKGLTGLHVEVLEHLRAVEYLSIKQCDKLKYLWETESEACKNLVRLSKLEVEYCKSLVSLEEKESNLISSMTSVKHMDLRNCESLKRCKFPNSIERLVIWDCPSITSLTFPTVQEGLRPSLNILDIRRCDNLGESWLLSNFLKPLEYLELDRLPNLKSMPEGCFVNLTRLILRGCDHIESITEKGLDFVHLRSLEIISCMGLKSFPHEHLQSLASLEELWISNCPSLDLFPCGLWPPNLSTLTIGGLKKPMSKWGQQNFPASLVTLYLHGENSGVVSFASNSTSSSSFVLPPSLSFLEINGFMHLKTVSEGLQHLTCLKGLVIDSCPKLGDLLVARQLYELSSLKVYNCLKLQEKCHSKRGKYRSIISGIPELYV